MPKTKEINILDQSKVFALWLFTMNKVQLYCFDFAEEHNPLFISTLNFFCSLKQDYNWNKGEYDITSLKAIQMNATVLNGVADLRKQYLASKESYHKKDISDLYNQLSQVRDGEWFLLFRITFHHPKLTGTETAILHNRLVAVNKGKTLAEADEIYRTKYAKLFDNYELQQFTDEGKSNIYVGEHDKKKRVCRFCGRSFPDVSFDEVAHAIPEALGNKHLFCYDECDSCNSDLSFVENNLTHWFEFRRNQAGVIRKHGGIPHGGGRNYVLGKDKSVQIYDNNIDLTTLGEYKLQGAHPVTDQGIYKALCKIVIDLIDEKYLPRLQQTVNWINGRVKSSFYPKVAQIYGLHPIPAPQEYIFVRKDGTDRDDAPFCFAVLRIFDMALLYAIPHVDNRMSFPDGYAQSFPYPALQFFNIATDTIEWCDFNKTEQRDPHVILDLSDCTFAPGTNGKATPEKLQTEKRPADWIDFPSPNVSVSDVKSVSIRNKEEVRRITADDLQYINGNITNVRCIIDISARMNVCISMRFTYKDVRTDNNVLTFDSTVMFFPKVVRGQTDKKDDILTIHYQLFLSLINIALDETCEALTLKHSDVSLTRQHLSVYDAFELYDKLQAIATDGTNVLNTMSSKDL